jgi:hypothetical protein
MTEVFDKYSKQTTIYYILQTTTVLTILFLIMAKVTNLQVTQKYLPYLIALVILALVTIVLNMILTSTNLVKMYIKDGELILSTESIIVDGTNISLSEVKKIVIKANDYRGARSSDGSGNRLEIYDLTDKVHACRFVIKSITQRDNLREILNQWSTNGVIVTSNGF